MSDPYAQIPDYPTAYTAGTAIARVVDGLGFRYHWATEGLTESDLDYRPSSSNRSIAETMHHVFACVSMVSCAFSDTRYEMPERVPSLPPDELRTQTLELILRVSETLKAMSEADLQGLRLRFGYGERTYEYPFWNALNGLIADGIYHVGQIVGYRRAAGNPMDPGVSVFLGKRRPPRD